MLIREIIESKAWVRFTGTMSNRVWFNTKTGEAITANDDGNHSAAVTNNPELFGLTQDDLAQAGLQPGERAHDYDGRALYPAMRQGWVRVYIDPKQPDYASNAEALALPALRRALIWYSEQIGTPRQFTLILRTGVGDRDGTAHRLNDAEQIEWFIRKGSLPRDRFEQPEPALVRQTNTTPHMFRGV